MISYIIIFTVFVAVIVFMTLHWLGYLFSRFSPSLKTQRDAVRMIAKLASSIKSPSKVSWKAKKKERDDDDNKGYA